MNWAEVWKRARPWLAAVLLIVMWLQAWPSFAIQRPTDTWYAPRLFTVWGLTLLFSLSCLAIGVRLVRWLQGPLIRDGFWVVSFATGVLVFGVAIAALGHLGLLVEQTFWALPLVLLLVGWEPLVTEVVGARTRWAGLPKLTTLELILGALGLVGVALAVFPVLSPENVNFDARWYHLGIAERYAVEGAITKSVEGNHLITGPHLASLLYTWAFLWQQPTFDRVLLANHLEVACFVGTLAAVPPLARALLPKGSPGLLRLSWVSVLLFPMLYIYDTGLMAGADHVAALWAPTSVLAWFQAKERGDSRSWALFGLNLAALALTKYTSVVMVAPISLIIAVVAFKPGPQWKAHAKGPLVAAAVAFVVTSMLWLRNLAFYRNPVYPLAAKWFPSTPWTVDSPVWRVRYSRELFVPPDGSLWMRLRDTGEALWNYHLSLYTWSDFTQNLPIFGSLYSVSLVLLPFVRGARRLWLMAVVMHLSIAIWFNLAHQLRYLTILVPVMGAACAVLAAEVWRWKHLGARLALIGVVGAQVVVAGDVPFVATHRMNGGQSAFARAAIFLGRGLSERSMERFAIFREWEQIGQALPPAARVLVHSMGPSLGIGRVTLNDTPGLEYGLNYAELGSVTRVHEKLRELGVSHLGWREWIRQSESAAGELLFLATASTATEDRFSKDGWTFGSLMLDAPEEPKD